MDWTNSNRLRERHTRQSDDHVSLSATWLDINQGKAENAGNKHIFPQYFLSFLNNEN